MVSLSSLRANEAIPMQKSARNPSKTHAIPVVVLCVRIETPTNSRISCPKNELGLGAMKM